MKKHYNWKGVRAPNNIKIHWVDPEKNLLPRGLLNNNKKMNPNAKNYKPKLNASAKNYTPKGSFARNPRARNMTKKRKN